MAEETTDPMMYIWEKVPKTAQGFIHYLPGDIPYLYRNGFVDAIRYTYQQWKEAFKDCLQLDGTYLVNKNKFLSLRKYRYSGPCFQPFEPSKVREGEWNDEELKKLFDKSIKPSSSISEDIFWNSIKALKNQGLVQNGNLLVNKAVKTQLAYLIERFPSPRRRLEKEVSRIREERESQTKQVAKDRDASLFVSGKLSSETKLEDFKKLETSVPLKSASPVIKDSKPTLDIKSLRKPGKKISG